MTDKLEELLHKERDAALEEAEFERTRANSALARNKQLREELAALREELKTALRAAGPSPGPDASAREGDLAERLKLAMDTNWRLEKQRARLEKKIAQLRGELTGHKGTASRLERKVRALEGQLRIQE